MFQTSGYERFEPPAKMTTCIATNMSPPLHTEAEVKNESLTTPKNVRGLMHRDFFNADDD